MDLLVEKGNNKTYLSQLGFLVTSFEEGAPTIARNSTNIQGRSGSVDFGGWHESKKVKLEGFYRAEDQYEEETLKERLFALLSDPEGIYITEMRGEIGQGFERPGETEGEVYEHMMTRPSHKRFYVYASSIENELQGNIGGTVLYKMSVEFTTLKLPYGESVPRDLDIKPNVPYYGRNLYLNSKTIKDSYIKYGDLTVTIDPFNSDTNMWHIVAPQVTGKTVGIYLYGYADDKLQDNSDWSYSADVKGTGNIYMFGIDGGSKNPLIGTIGSEWSRISQTGQIGNPNHKTLVMYFDTNISALDVYIKLPKLEIGKISTPWSLAPEDPEYNAWYTNTYYKTDNLVIPYAGTVPCNQLEQGFTIEFTAKEGGSGLKIDINGKELVYDGQVYDGDVLKLSGYEYTKNGLSVVRTTNKAYFKLLPNVNNTLSASLHGTIKVLNFQNLYA
ncbi:hypothetical protein [Lactobacillus phage Silenus]|nr:hypothetical protein [Lactobacillus phage Silenus]